MICCIVAPYVTHGEVASKAGSTIYTAVPHLLVAIGTELLVAHGSGHAQHVNHGTGVGQRRELHPHRRHIYAQLSGGQRLQLRRRGARRHLVWLQAAAQARQHRQMRGQHGVEGDCGRGGRPGLSVGSQPVRLARSLARVSRSPLLPSLPDGRRAVDVWRVRAPELAPEAADCSGSAGLLSGRTQVHGKPGRRQPG